MDYEIIIRLEGGLDKILKIGRGEEVFVNLQKGEGLPHRILIKKGETKINFYFEIKELGLFYEIVLSKNGYKKLLNTGEVKDYFRSSEVLLFDSSRF